MFTHKLPPRVIPWTAIIIGVLLTVDLGHSLWENLQARSQVNDRITELDAKITEVKAKSETLPETITVEQTVTKELPVAAMRRPSDGEPTGGTGPKVIDEPRTVTVTQKKKIPNPERAQAEQQLRDTVVEFEAEGFKFKMINEATWSMVFKICFLWAFVLLTLGLYRRFTRA